MLSLQLLVQFETRWTFDAQETATIKKIRAGNYDNETLGAELDRASKFKSSVEIYLSRVALEIKIIVKCDLVDKEENFSCSMADPQYFWSVLMLLESLSKE